MMTSCVLLDVDVDAVLDLALDVRDVLDVDVLHFDVDVPVFVFVECPILLVVELLAGVPVLVRVEQLALVSV